MSSVLSPIVVLAAAFATLTAQLASAASVNAIAAWTRQPGNFTDDQNPSRGKVTTIDPNATEAKLRTRKLYDIQYEAPSTYRGIALEDLIRAYPAHSKSDAVLLHFAAGMKVLVAFRDLKSLDAFLALETCDGPKKCSVTFADAPRVDVYGADEDPRPVVFSWNKLVVSRPWHPDKHALDRTGFSPWRHVDSLVGMEFVDYDAYRQQFAVGSSGGDAIFLRRCQTCHGVRYVGATYGWDFVTPLALYEKREPSNLLSHVKYPKAMAQRLGLQMPPQKDIKGAETEALWRWMRDVSNQKLNAYKPLR